MDIRVNNSLVRAFKGDITEEKTCAIVNAANNALRGGGGVDGAIHRKGGGQILDECRKYSSCPTGEVRTTGAGLLKAKYVIHTAGPVYENKGIEAKLLLNCYLNSMKEAKKLGCDSISFPSISTGVYGYPIKDACKIATQTIVNFLKTGNHLVKLVHFVLFSDSDLKVYEDCLKIYQGEQ